MKITKALQLNVKELLEFGKAIDLDDFFRPMDLTDPEVIKPLVWGTTNDEYWFIEDNGRLCAMGMIRGWDGDWEEKVLGVIVRDKDRGRRYGSLMLEFLCCLAVRYKLDI